MGIQNRGLQRRFMGDKNVVCVAVSDCDTTRRNAARDTANKRYDNKDCKVYVDFRELIARDDIDAVSIEVRAVTRERFVVEEFLKRCLSAGCKISNLCRNVSVADEDEIQTV